MLERFDESSVRVMVSATDASRRLGHNYVGSEQIFYGIVDAGDKASRALASFGVYRKNVMTAMLRIIGRGSGFVANEIPFTPRAKNVLEDAWTEAKKWNSDTIKPEHLLLALLSQDSGVANRILEGFDIDNSEIRGVVLEVINGYPVPEPIEAAVFECECDEGFFRASSLQEARDNLNAIDCFIRSNQVSDTMLSWLDEKESVIGVYMNAEDNFLVLRNNGIHCYDGDAIEYFGFDSIRSVSLPDSEDDRYLTLILEPNDAVLMLPVWHDTEGVLDLYRVYEFIFHSHQAPSSEPDHPKKLEIREIGSKSDLIAYLRQPSVTTDGLEDLAEWLGREAPILSWLKALEIEPAVLQDPNALRLFALMLTRNPNCVVRN